MRDEPQRRTENCGRFPSRVGRVYVSAMRFAQRVYLFCGIWGVLVCLPIFWNEPWMAQHSPPAVTHPEYYYGFFGVTLAVRPLGWETV